MPGFSPLNCGSGPRAETSRAADFSAQVLPFLQRRFEIELFHDSFAKHALGPTFHYLTALQRHKEKPYDIFFYQLEDAQAAKFTRMHVGLMPGIALFHDFLFTDDGPEPILNSAWSDSVRCFGGELAAFPERGKEYKKEGKAALREVALSAVPVFISEKDHGDFLRSVKQSIVPPAERLSFFLPCPAAGELAQLPLPAAGSGRESIVVFCGSPRMEHRAHQLLKALTCFRGRLKLHWLIDPEELGAARKLLLEFDAESMSEIKTPRTPETFARALADANFAVHTHFSVFGQTGPYLQQSLMAGRPALITDFGCSDFLPDQVVFKIPPGAGESRVLQDTFDYLLRCGPGELGALAALSKEYAVETFSAASVAEQLAGIFERALPLLRKTLSAWQAFEGKARTALLAEVSDFLATDTFPGQRNRLFTDSFVELGWK